MRSRILGQVGGQNLDGRQLVEFPVPGLVDGAHAARAQDFQQVVFAEAARTGQGRERGGRLGGNGTCPHPRPLSRVRARGEGNRGVEQSMDNLAALGFLLVGIGLDRHAEPSQ